MGRLYLVIGVLQILLYLEIRAWIKSPVFRYAMVNTMPSSPYNPAGEYQPRINSQTATVVCMATPATGSFALVMFRHAVPLGSFIHRSRLCVLVLPATIAGKHGRVCAGMGGPDLVAQRGTVDPGSRRPALVVIHAPRPAAKVQVS